MPRKIVESSILLGCGSTPNHCVSVWWRPLAISAGAGAATITRAAQSVPVLRGTIEGHCGLGLARSLHELGRQPPNAGHLGRGKTGPRAAEEEFAEQVVITKSALRSRPAFGEPAAAVEFIQQLARGAIAR